MKKNHILLVICLMLVVSIASIGGTIAWLTDSTNEVVNTFSPTDISVTLEETGTTLENGKETKDFDVVPGVDITKDPKVSASSDVPYYVFVQVIEEHWPTAKYVDEDGTEKLKVCYEIAAGWTPVDGTNNVYYIDVAEGSDLPETSVLKGNTVIVADTLTKEEMAGFATNKPSLTFKAYAIQKANGSGNFTPAEAWAIVSAPAA